MRPTTRPDDVSYGSQLHVPAASAAAQPPSVMPTIGSSWHTYGCTGAGGVGGGVGGAGGDGSGTDGGGGDPMHVPNGQHDLHAFCC